MPILFLFLILPFALTAGWIPPDESLDKLVQGNKRYVNQTLKFANRSTERRLQNIEGQTPFAAIVACSDSRGSPDIIFDQGIGDLFVVRVAGNVVGPVELASVEYSVLALESSLVLVLGHQNCGAVQAVIAGNTKGIEPVAELIEPAVSLAKKKGAPLLEAAIRENALRFAQILRNNPLLAEKIESGRLKVYGAYYDFNSGKVEIFND